MKLYKEWLISIILIALIVFLASCAGFDWLFGVDSTGTDLPGPAPYEDVAKTIPNVAPTPWAEIIGGILAGAGALYIAGRRLVHKFKKNK